MTDKIQNILVEAKKIFDIESQKAKHGKLNILSMFKDRNENAHSKVLAYLLDPKEKHEHNYEFLKQFLTVIYGLDEFCDFDLSTTKVFIEYPTYDEKGIYNGRIDIYLEHESFVIIIENKLDTQDHDKQLKTYHNFVKSRKENIKRKIYVFYLTLYGNEPTEIDSRNVTDKCISYRKHILEWLKSLNIKDNQTTLYSAIEQYTLCVEKITEQTKEDIEMVHNLVKMLKKDEYKLKPEEFNALYTSLIVIDKVNRLNLIKEKLTFLKHEIIYIRNQEEMKENELIDNAYMGVGIKLKDNFIIAYMIYPSQKQNYSYISALTLKGKSKIENFDIHFDETNDILQNYKLDNIDEWYFSKNHSEQITGEEANNVAIEISRLYKYFIDKLNIDK